MSSDFTSSGDANRADGGLSQKSASLRDRTDNAAPESRRSYIAFTAIPFLPAAVRSAAIFIPTELLHCEMIGSTFRIDRIHPWRHKTIATRYGPC